MQEIAEAKGLQVEHLPISSLSPHPRNYRAHPEEQLQHLEQSLRESGWYRNVVIARDNTILAGHGIIAAAVRLGLTAAPCVRLDLDPEDPRALKVLTADNELPRLAVDDTSQLASLLQDISGTDLGLFGTGHDDASLAELLAQSAPPEVKPERYSAAVESPVYQVTGACPEPHELVDTGRYEGLLFHIDHLDAPPEVLEFLRYGAARHLKFDYALIAEFYAHASAEVQALMEDSALVIVDVDRAIELGFAKLTEELRQIAEAADDDES